MSKKIKIFQFPIANSNGGISRYAVNNWKYLDKNKFECDFGTVSKKLDYEQEITNSGARVKYISCYAEDNKEQFEKELYELFLKEKYDVIHLHTSYWKSFLAEEIAIKCNIPKIIVHSHSTQIDEINENKRMLAEEVHNKKKLEFNISLATDFWACSKLAADWLFGQHISRNKIHIMKNAIDVEKFLYNSEIRDRIRKELDLENSFVIGNVGRFSYQKNQEFLLNVFSTVCKKIENAKLVLVGDGELKEHYLKLSEELEIKNKVIFTGARTDINELLQAFDLFCLPSRFEGLPIVLIEAQTSGLKCLASNFITDEVSIAGNMKLLPLSIEKWVDEIEYLQQKGYVRNNLYKEITDAGYNIKHQIKNIEKAYLENFDI